MPGQKHILVVDDEEDVLRIIKSGLARYGHKIDAFADPFEALEHFRHNYAMYDLVLSDVRMPGMNGFEFAKSIRKINSSTEILIMTAFEINRYELSKEIPFIRIKDLIMKPFMLSRICEIIDAQPAKPRK